LSALSVKRVRYSERASMWQTPGIPTLPYLSAGGRLGGEVDLTRWLTARAGVDFLAGLVRPALLIDGRPAWTSPAFSSLVGAGLVASF
jgi:hypothetical protein